MTVEISMLKPGDIAAVYVLLQHNGWTHRITSAEQFVDLVTASRCNFIATVDHQVVGYIRAITDGLSNGYLSMLVVDPAYRQQGIGRMLVNQAMATAPDATWVLRAGREGATTFFEKLGFQVSSIAMERNRP